MKRRILSIITALALCLSLCPAWAFAAEGGSEPADLVLNVGELTGEKIEINGNTVIMDGEEAQIFSTLVLTGTAENLWIRITSSGQVTLRDLNINIVSSDIYTPLLELNNGSSVCVEGTVTLESSGPVIVVDNNSVLTGPGSLKITYSGTDTAVLLAKEINIGGDLAISAPDGYSVEAMAGYVCPITAQNITLTHDQDRSNTLNLNAMDMLTINDQVIVAKVTPVDDTQPQFAYLTEAELDSAFAEASNYANATFTLLADVERETALDIRINCILDLGGHTICCKKEDCLVVHFGNTTIPLIVTIRGEGQVISTNNTALTVWGNVKLEGGTFTGNGENYGGVYVNNEGAKLSIRGEKVIIRNTGGGYGLAIFSADSIKLRAGTYSGEKGAIKIFNSITLGDLLEVLDGIRCVYFDENGAPIIGQLDQKALYGTVTVGECTHDKSVCEYTPNEDDGTHTMTCLACGRAEAEEACTYSGEYEHDETNHWQTCTLCVGKKTEGHSWVHWCAPATSTIKRYCDKCKIETVVGTASVTPDFSVAYGETGSVKLACTAELADGYSLEPQVEGENCWYLQALSNDQSSLLGSALQVQLPDKLPAGDYSYTASPRLFYQGANTVVGSFNLSGSVTVTPAPLTVTGATAADRAYDGTNSVQITGVTLDGVLNSDNVSVDLTGLTGTLSGSDAGTYTGVTLPRLTLTGGAASNYTLTQPVGAVPASVTISKAPLTVTGVTIKTRPYKPTYHTAEVSGVTFTGLVNGETLALGQDYTAFGNYDDPNAGENKSATILVELKSSAKANNYTLPKDSSVNATGAITKAGPTVTDVSVSSPAIIYESTSLTSITLTHGAGDPAGTVTLDAGQTLTIGTKEYNWTFTPNDANNYNTATGTISLTVAVDALQSIAVTTPPNKTAYTYGESFDRTGMVVTATYASGAAKVVTDEVTISPATLAVATTALTVNYQGKTASQAITVSPKTVSSPTITLTPSTFEYDGQPKTPAVTVKDGDVVIPSSEYTVEYADNTNIGTATVTITDKEGGNYIISGSGSATFTITKSLLTNATVSVSGSFTYNGQAKAPQIAVTLNNTVIPSGEYDISYSNSNGGAGNLTNAGTVTVTVTAKASGNYEGSATGAFRIDPAVLTVSGAAARDRAYDGTSTVEITGVTLSGIVSGDTVSVSTTGLTGTLNGSDVGTYTAVTLPRLTLTGGAASNYTPPQPAGAVTSSVTIRKAPALTPKTGDLAVANQQEHTYTYGLGALRPDVPEGMSLGSTAVTYTLGTVSLGSYYTGGAEIQGQTLTLPILAVESDKAEGVGTVTVIIHTQNFEDMTATINVRSVKKTIPTGEPTLSGTILTYGQALKDITLSGSMKDGETSVPGSFAWSNPDNRPAVQERYAAAWTFTPTDNNKYAIVTGTVILTITKATPSLKLTPSPAALPNGGTVTLTLSGLPAGGSATVTCSDENITVTKGSGDTWTADLPAGGASYTFTATYAGDGNHNSATANCTVSVDKIRPALILTASPVSPLIGGGMVTLTLSGLPSGGSATVTCSGGITVTAGAGNTWTATLPNSTATYTFTASYAGNDSYHGANTTCTVETKEVVILPDQPTGENGEQLRLVMETGIDQVPTGLQSIETLNTPEKLETAMKTEITQATPGIPEANTAVYDVALMVSTDGGATWTKATKDNFPSGGLTITLPYPEGTNSSYRFTVVHMFTASDFPGKNPGDTEIFTPDKVKNTAQGIQVVVTGLSPISVGWTAPATTPDTPSGNHGGGGGSWSASTYAVTVEKSEHGKVTASRTNASCGSTVTLTVTPDSGYVLDTLTVTDSRGNEIKLTAQGGGKYTFTMPGRAVTVKASFVPLPDDTQKPCDGGADCPSRGFTDLGSVGTWYHEAVDYVLRHRLMNGYNNGTFGPNDNLSRAQFAQILFNKEGRPIVNYLLQYGDVAEGAWYTEAIRWATSLGIIGGYGNGMFGPNDNITREQLAVMLWRYAGSPAATDRGLHFTDADRASGYALEALRWAVENGVINGKGGGILDPQGLATRAQLAQMLMNFLKDE